MTTTGSVSTIVSPVASTVCCVSRRQGSSGGHLIRRLAINRQVSCGSGPIEAGLFTTRGQALTVGAIG
jgi:hypothetical protein